MPLFALRVSLFGYFDGFKTRPRLARKNIVFCWISERQLRRLSAKENIPDLFQ